MFSLISYRRKLKRALCSGLAVMLLPAAATAQNPGQAWRVRMQEKAGGQMVDNRVRLRIDENALLVTRHGKEKLRIPLAEILNADFDEGQYSEGAATSAAALAAGIQSVDRDGPWSGFEPPADGSGEGLIAAAAVVGIILLIAALNRPEHHVTIRWRTDAGEQMLVLKTRTQDKADQFLSELRQSMAKPVPQP